MQSQTRRFYLIFILVAALFSPLAAQEQSQESPEKQEDRRFSPAGVPDDWEIKVYEAKHQSIRDLMSVLQAILTKPYTYSFSDTYNTLTLTAPPDIHNQVRVLIERFDKPAKNVDLQFYLLRGVRQPNGPPEELPANLRPILEDLSDVTQFQSFQLIAAPSARTRSGESVGLQGGSGSAHHLRLRSVSLEADGDIHLKDLLVEVREEDLESGRAPGYEVGSATLNLSVKLKNGETVVLGSSQLSREKGTALIVIVRASIIE